jgi:uncharacterized protein YdeI (YjbR/CyaY-like superfamily)
MTKVSGIPPNLPLVYAADRRAWRAWLAENHASCEGAALVFHKKGSGKPSVSYEEAVEEALCFGWIDGRVNAMDAERYRQLFSPRRPRSTWAKSNKERVQRLIAAGLMTPVGMAKIEAAKRDGSWAALDASERLEIPPALASALARRVRAQRFFDARSASMRKLLIRWVSSAKREETRHRRIAEIVTAALRGELPESIARQIPNRK